jgi:hypothetical protein
MIWALLFFIQRKDITEFMYQLRLGFFKVITNINLSYKFSTFK